MLQRIPACSLTPLQCKFVHAGQKTVVVAFGSAPGVPNWGGLLKRLVQQDFERHHLAFDILYVVDGARNWYNGACAPPCS